MKPVEIHKQRTSSIINLDPSIHAVSLLASGTQALLDKLYFTHRVIGFCDNQRLPFYILESTGTTP